MSIASVMPSNHPILCYPLPLLLSIFPSIRVFSSESVLWIRWPKYWSFAGSQHTRPYPWQGHEGENLTGKADQVFRGSKKASSRDPTHDRSQGERLTGKADQVIRDSEKLPRVLTLKISVFLMLASIDYSLISVTQAEGLPRSLPK